MEDLKLAATRRHVLRKKTRFLRREGITPIHLFGPSIEPQALQCETTMLQKIITRAGMTRPIELKIGDEKESNHVFIREIQKHPISRQLIHVDFYQVRKGGKIRVAVPIILVGEAPAAKLKGSMLIRGVSSLDIECLPEKLPSQIEVDISSLKELEQTIYVKDIALDPDITVHIDSEQIVVRVSETKEEEVVAAVPEAEAMVEGEAVAAEAQAEEKPEQSSTEQTGAGPKR